MMPMDCSIVLHIEALTMSSEITLSKVIIILARWMLRRHCFNSRGFGGSKPEDQRGSLKRTRDLAEKNDSQGKLLAGFEFETPDCHTGIVRVIPQNPGSGPIRTRTEFTCTPETSSLRV